MSRDSNYPEQTPHTYVSPLPAGNKFHFVSAYTIYPYDYKYISTVYTNYEETYELKITTPSLEVKTETYKRYISGEHGLPPEHVRTEGTNNGIEIELQSGIYIVQYNFTYREGLQNKTVSCSYRFQVVHNRYPLKKQTIKEVIERQLDVAEPLVAYGYSPLDDER